MVIAGGKVSATAMLPSSADAASPPAWEQALSAAVLASVAIANNLKSVLAFFTSSLLSRFALRSEEMKFEPQRGNCKERARVARRKMRGEFAPRAVGAP